MLKRISAAIVLGLLALFVIGIPLNGFLQQSNASGPLIALGIAVVIAATGRASTVYSRLFLANAIGALTWPFAGIAYSVMVHNEAVASAAEAGGGTHAAYAGAEAGAVVGGALLTGAGAFAGFFVGLIFLALAFFMRTGRTVIVKQNAD